MKTIEINPGEDLIFDEKVSEQCKSCKRYGSKATCPPNIKDISYYRELLVRYKYGTIYYCKFKTGEDWQRIGRESSKKIHERILNERDSLFNMGHYFAVGFGGGSCKLCESCSNPCRYPNKSLIPLEGTGVNIKETMKKFNIDIEFPVENYFYRIGAIFYD